MNNSSNWRRCLLSTQITKPSSPSSSSLPYANLFFLVLVCNHSLFPLLWPVFQWKSVHLVRTSPVDPTDKSGPSSLIFRSLGFWPYNFPFSLSKGPFIKHLRSTTKLERVSFTSHLSETFYLWLPIIFSYNLVSQKLNPPKFVRKTTPSLYYSLISTRPVTSFSF